jgi:hypothetical protein
MELSEIKVYRINDQVVWRAGQPIADLEAIINRKLPTPGIRPYQAAAVAQIASQPTASIEMPAGAGKSIPTPVRTAAAKGGSKKEQAIAIYRNMAGASKAEIIQAFITQLSMSAAGASTYYYTAKAAVVS